ncbi:unnamed protein product [Cunninghamella blakesleeana]
MKTNLSAPIAPHSNNFKNQKKAFLLIEKVWYIMRSIKGMRKRLREENQAQMAIIENMAEHDLQQQKT